MIRSYLLPVVTVNNTEQVQGIGSIHDALLLATEDPYVRKLIMDTTATEHDNLVGHALDVWEATQEEIDRYNACVEVAQPNPDTIRAAEILATSPDIITQPEMWELMRIYGRRLGFIT